MADIFGRKPEDYKFIQSMTTEAWTEYQSKQAELRPDARRHHDFRALGSGPPKDSLDKPESLQAVLWLSDHIIAMQTMIDEILLDSWRIPRWVALNDDVAPGAAHYGARRHTECIPASRVSDVAGWAIPKSLDGLSLQVAPLHWYMLSAAWSVDELRGAMYASEPLDLTPLHAAVTGNLEVIESVTLTGGQYYEFGLLNMPGDRPPQIAKDSLPSAPHYRRANCEHCSRTPDRFSADAPRAAPCSCRDANTNFSRRALCWAP